MTEKSYKNARETAAKELEKLIQQQQVTEQRILHLRQMIASLDALSGIARSKVTKLPGLKDAVLSVFKAAPPDTFLSARDIRQALIEMGFDAGGYSSLLASIYIVLRRLKDKGEIEQRLSEKKGSPVFRQKFRDYLAEL